MSVNKILVNNLDSNYTHSIFDISEYTGNSYSTLSDALDDVPIQKRKGGMTIRYIQTNDNEYVQFRFMLSGSFTSAQFTNPANWQGVDDVPTAYSDNLVNSGGVYPIKLSQDVIYTKELTKLLFTQKAINLGSYNIGDVVDVTPVTNTSIKCNCFKISPKIKTFKITGVGGSNPRLWAFLDDEYKLISVEDASVQKVDYILSVPNDAVYLVVNFNVNLSQTISLTQHESAPNVININNLTGQTGTFYTLQTAITLVPKEIRVSGCIITFRKSGTVCETWQYLTGNVDDTYWLDVSRWLQMNVDRIHECTGGGLDKNTGEITSSSYVSTGFLLVEDGIFIKGYQGSSNAACCFYDDQFEFISALNLSTGNVVGYLGATGFEIPTGAKYFRISGIQGDTFAVGAGLSASTFWVNDWKNSDIKDYKQFLIDGKAYNSGAVTIGSVVPLVDNSSFYCIKIKCSQNQAFEIAGRGGVNPRLWAWADADMKLISMSDANITDKVKLVAPSSASYLLVNVRHDSNEIRVIRFTPEETPEFTPAKWMAMGDSITEGYYSYVDSQYPDGHGVLNSTKTWVRKMSTITGKPVTNVGKGGTGYVYQTPNARELVDTLDFTGIELVTLHYGINDYKGGATLGTMSDDVATGGTVVSNMRYVIEKIQSERPTAKIIVILPFNARGYSHTRLGDYSTNYALDYQVNGKTLNDFCDAMKEVCEYYGIQYIDASHTSIISRNNMVDLLPDGVHPSEDAHSMIAREFSQRITLY